MQQKSDKCCLLGPSHVEEAKEDDALTWETHMGTPEELLSYEQ